MNKRLTRREWLAAIVGTGIAAALGDALATYPPWMDYDVQAAQIWDTPLRTETNPSGQMRELVRYATLAPSGHNAQPWKFSVLKNAITIMPDYARRLPIVDPEDRELWISLGCALENLEIAAQNVGYDTEITYPTPNTDSITLHLQPTRVHRQSRLFEAIPHRQNTRSLYDGQPVPLTDLKKLEGAATGADASLQIITTVPQKESILAYIKAGDQRQYGDQPFLDELVSWIRFNKPEALHSLDGLSTRCSGNPEVPRWLGKHFVTTASAPSQSATDVKNVRSSSGLIVIATPQDDKRHWIEAGRVYERLALTLTLLGMKTAFLNQPMEVPELRSQLRSSLALGTSQPQLLLRFGYAAAMPRSLRRPVDEVLV